MGETSGNPIMHHQMRSAWERFDEVVESYPDNLALVCVHQPSELYGLGSPGDYGRWSFRDVHTGITRLSGSLKSLGLAADSLLFVLLGNSLEHLLATWAGYQLGCVHVSIHPSSLSNSTEARHMIQTVLDNRPSPSAAVLVQDQEAADRFDLLFPQLKIIKIIVGNVQPATSAWTSFDQLMRYPESPSTPTPHASSFETSIFFSSGTTSLPKPCLMDVPSWISSLASRSTLGSFVPGERVMSLVPSSHVFGYMGQMFALTHGGTLVYPSYIAFDSHTTMETLRTFQCKYLIMVSALVHAFISADLRSARLPPIDTAIFSGMTLSTAVAKEFQTVVAARAVENIYGMTEGAFCSTGPVEDLESISREGFLAAGLPMVGSRVQLCAPDSTEPLPPGVAGEVHYCGYQTAKSYLGISSESFYTDDEGCAWYKTGDQAIIYEPDGLLFPVGRYKELIIRGGKNISPSAIEAVLNRDPELHQLNPQAVPMPDSVAGEVPVIVVNRAIQPAQVQQIMKLILSQMGTTYIPDKVLTIQNLGPNDYPRTTSGKVQKAKLAALAREYAGAEVVASETATGLQTEIRDRVTQLWAEALSTTPGELDTNATLSELVDSITLMRMHSKASKLTNKSVTIAAWMAAKSIAHQVALLENAETKQGNHHPPGSNQSLARTVAPGVEDMVHLLGDASRLQATQDLVQRAIASYELTWNDVEDVFPATDFQHILRQAHVVESWEFFVCIRTWGCTTQQLQSAMETTLAVHPMLRSFAVLDDTHETLLVTIRPTPRILDRCIVDYGEVATMDDVHKLVINFPLEHRITKSGPLFCALIVYVKQIESAVFVADVCHSIMDATYYELFQDDLELALNGQPLHPHVPYKSWCESYYLLQGSLAARPAFEYHLSQMQRVPDGPVALWPTPSQSSSIAPGRAEEGLYLLEFGLPALLAMRHHHPTLMTSVVVKTALALLTLFHTKHANILLLNIEAARGHFPFLPASLSREGPLDAMRVAGPAIAGNVELITYQSQETVLQLLYRVQAQQRAVTQYANAPWRRILQEMPRMQQLYSAVANHLIFNWTGTGILKSNDKKAMHQQIQRQEIFCRPTTGLMVDAGASGKDGTELCISLSGAVANTSNDWIRDIAQRLQAITTWLTHQGNWERPVASFAESLQMAS